jgi:hypothetical protein
MRPSSKRCSARFLLVAVLCLSCASAPAQHATAPAKSDAEPERRAPGVAESSVLVLPAPARAGNSRDQLLLLRSPPATELARGTVREFLRAAVNEASERLEPLLSEQAFVETGNGRQPARAFWQSRFSQLDYTELRGQLLFRDADVQTFRAEDLARLPANRRMALELGDDEVAVRVPIRISWAGRTRLFGDELLFRLQPSGSGFEIAEISEDFRLP